jgi:hypothetical protein
LSFLGPGKTPKSSKYVSVRRGFEVGGNLGGLPTSRDFAESPNVRLSVMKPAYQLKADSRRIAAIQKATLTTDEFGIEQTHGLLGSPEWWEQISSGRLPLHTLRGVIVERFWGSMADWPEIKVKSDNGETSHWTREVNVKEQDALYIPGQRIEIDYVLQRHRAKSFDKGAERKVVIEIRIDASTQAPGSYERLSAKELAQAVSMFYPHITEAAYHLSELGRVPGVMDEEAHRLFTNVAQEVDAVVRQNKRAAMSELLDRWKDPVLATCKRLLENDPT